MKKRLSVILTGILFFALSGKNLDSVLSDTGAGAREIIIPAGEYEITKTVTVNRDLRIVFAHGAVLRSGVSPVFQVQQGRLALEGQGGGGRIFCLARSNSIPEDAIGTVIDITSSTGTNPASLYLKNMQFESDRGIDGVVRSHNNGKIGCLEIDNCRFFSRFRGISIFNIEVTSCRITNSLFDGGQVGMLINARIPGGVYVCGNTVRNFGKSGIILGKSGQIAEKITSYLPMATVHDNRLIRGGFGAGVKDSYIHGILVIGHNVSVQGNIVRDVNRGVPVPGAKCGHQIVENGKVFKERMRKSGDAQVRLAGSAIYLKANRATVHSNICTNSGWRSVIEIKTGGKEYYTSVANNVVDGRSLAIDDSFAFECNSGRSLWANNIVYDVPHQAFVVRCGYENTFMNNLIVNAKVGFALSGNPHGEKELINGNRFIDVKCPVSLNGKVPHHAVGADIHHMPQSLISADMELPEPSVENAGRLIVRGKGLFCCVKTENGFKWMELNGKIVPEKKFVPAGNELMINADQSGNGFIPDELKNKFHPGWKMFMMSAREKMLSPTDGHVTFDQRNFRSGGRSLKIKFKNTTGFFHLTQSVVLVPGKRYRATAVVKSEEPQVMLLSVRTDKGFSRSCRASEDSGWQVLSFDFTVPAGHRSCIFSVSSKKMMADKAAWLDSVSLKELVEESAVLRSRKKTIGDNLIKQDAGWKINPGKGLLHTGNKNGILSIGAKNKTVNAVISQKIKFFAGKSYRLKVETRSDEKFVFSTFITSGKQKISKSFESGNSWNSHIFEFTVPAAGGENLNVWIGKITPGKNIQFRKFECRELE